MYCYRNDYHNTSYNTRKSPADLAAIEERLVCGQATAADKALVRRMHAELCGHDHCTCGDTFGARPSVADQTAKERI